jgi:hypothetical protein
MNLSSLLQQLPQLSNHLFQWLTLSLLGLTIVLTTCIILFKKPAKLNIVDQVDEDELDPDPEEELETTDFINVLINEAAHRGEKEVAEILSVLYHSIEMGREKELNDVLSSFVVRLRKYQAESLKEKSLEDANHNPAILRFEDHFNN